MKMRAMRRRMLVASLLPVILVALLLALAFITTLMSGIYDAHEERSRSLARRMASASEYGLFVGNFGQLRTVLQGAITEREVRSAAILDPQSRTVLSEGLARTTDVPPLLSRESRVTDPDNGLDLVVQPIFASQTGVDDIYNLGSARDKAARQVLGYLVLEISHEFLWQEERKLLAMALAVTALGLLAGVLLALRLARDVIQPLRSVSEVVERIGDGDLQARASLRDDHPLLDLLRGLNAMAQSLESGRNELELRVAQATEAFRDKKDEAERATLAKSRFLAAASHDLRQPTQALGMFVTRLGQLQHTPEASALVHNLESAVSVTQDLLDSLLDMSRLDSDAVPVRLQSFQLSDLFDALQEALAMTALEAGLRLRVRTTSLVVHSDAALLQRILFNLVGNALRYTPRGGVIVAARHRPGVGMVRIEVWDSGIGIAPEHQKKVFQEFYQVHNNERDLRKGLGLGLHMVQRLAELLGHRVHLCSRPGVGSRFSVELPLAPDQTLLQRAPLELPLMPDTLHGQCVLIIEDDPLAREGLAGLLRSWGMHVHTAQSCAEALHWLDGGIMPHVIISDFRLPGGVDGLEAVRQLRAVAARPIPCCLMSGDTDAALVSAAQAAGLVLLHKPVRPAKLRSLLRRLVAEPPPMS